MFHQIVNIFHLAGILVPVEELKNIVIYISLEEEPGPCPKVALLFLLLFLLSLPFPD